MKKTILFTMVLMVLMSALVLADSDTKEIKIKDMRFIPQTLTIHAGDTVKWVNEESTVHDVTLDDNSWHAELEAADGEVSKKFDKVGEYTYHCAIHTFMTGKIIVEEKPARGEDDDVTEERTSMHGLENAILRVRKNETKDHLEQVLLEIRTKRAEHYDKMIALKNITIEEDPEREKVIVHGKGPAKLLGRFNWEYEYQYAVNEQSGELVRDRKWYDFVFTELKE